jgi:hypothetical protein
VVVTRWEKAAELFEGGRRSSTKARKEGEVVDDGVIPVPIGI